MTSSRRTLENARVAIVQEYLARDGGAENVLAEMAAILPQADLFVFFTLDPEDKANRFKGRKIQESFIAPVARKLKNYRVLFPLFPTLARRMPVTGNDLVVSSSFSLAKAVRLTEDQIHVCYCYTPPRWLWDMSDDYVESSGLGGMSQKVVRQIFARLRAVDLAAAKRVDHFIAISHFVAERIKRIYGRDSVVIYPPVSIDRFNPGSSREDYYFTVSRLVPYKKVDFLVQAFASMPGRRLVIAGSGPDLERLKAMAGSNVTFLGRISNEEVAARLAACRAFLFAAEEDFGIAPVEAQAAGSPVVALRRGGALETVIDGVTGVFFDEHSLEAFSRALARLEELLPTLSTETIRANALRFSDRIFREQMSAFLEAALLEGRPSRLDS